MPIEEPVIVSGGSVTIEVNDSFKDVGGKPGKKVHKHDKGRLRRIMVNDKKVADLNETDKVEIIYEY